MRRYERLGGLLGFLESEAHQTLEGLPPAGAIQLNELLSMPGASLLPFAPPSPAFILRKPAREAVPTPLPGTRDGHGRSPYRPYPDSSILEPLPLRPRHGEVIWEKLPYRPNPTGSPPLQKLSVSNGGNELTHGMAAAQLSIPGTELGAMRPGGSGGVVPASRMPAPLDIRFTDPLASAPEMGGRPIEPLIEAIANASPAMRNHLHAVIDRTVANHNKDEDYLDPESAAWARVLHENLDARVDGTLDADAVRINLRTLPERFAELERSRKRGLARRDAILAGEPATFTIDDNPEADGDHPLVQLRMSGQVEKYQQIIEDEAKKADIDPDLVKAIMYIENTHGLFEKLVAAPFDQDDSILPMNIDSSYWRGLGYTRDQLRDPRINIRAGVQILKRIQERLRNPMVADIATLYNSLGKSRISDYSARVEDIYRRRLWENAGRSPR